jgi:hypothetical protein
MNYSLLSASVINDEPPKKHTKTQRATRTYDTPKLNSIINAIHNSPDEEEDNFIPLEPPHIREKGGGGTPQNPEDYYKKLLQENDKSAISSQYQHAASYISEPSYILPVAQRPASQPLSGGGGGGGVGGSSTSNEALVRKLNYLIYLMEEQKSERSDTLMEEVILYSFLGIFIIFVIDSFTRLGKYTR